MAKVYRTASGARDPSGRDLVFEQWFEDNIVTAEGGALEQRIIYRAYAREVAKGIQLGPQGVERMLNQLKVKRSVRQGKPMRLGVGFKADVGAPAPFHAVAGSVNTTAPPRAGEDINLQPAYRIANECLMERHRQIVVEGFDAAHDDASDPGAHERAAACYAYAAAQPDRLAPFVETSAKQPREGRLGWIVRETIILMWPWATQWWKPHTEAPDWKRRCMVKAAALLLAAIERHDREAARQALADSQASQMTGV